MRHYTHYIYIALLAAVLALAVSCGKKQAALPSESTPVAEQADIYPDYRDIVVPPNIAPLNFQVKSAGEEYAASFTGGGQQLVAAAGKDGKLDLDSAAWGGLLSASRGKDVEVTLYARRAGGWVKFPSYRITVAAEPIDRYLSYRLIEPSYELYRQLGLYQRDLQGFGVRTIYENNRNFDEKKNHCVNCHNYQNNSTRRMLFHVRAKHGGTVFVEDGKAEKVNMACDSILAGCTYPAWHPTRNWVVFSSNKTGQAFHIIDKQKVEVVDYGSDLVLYDADSHTLTNICKTEADLETFPCWSPDGTRLYYTSAHVPEFANTTDEQKQMAVKDRFENIRYDVMSLSFDPATRRFSQPVTEVACAAQGKSAAVARVSPDGRYLLFTLADYGQFHIWHNAADLYVKDLRTGETRPLSEANSPGSDSYHSWSSNSRWIVFVSRRDDGAYSRPYIAYFDRNGRAHKAFIVPQRDPEQNLLLPKSYNVPELTRDAVRISEAELTKCVHNDANVRKVTYRR